MEAAPDIARRLASADRESVQHLLHWLAATGVALVLVVIVSSAYLRLSQAGLSCPDWPACYGRVAQHAEIVGPAQQTARIAHRFAASAVGLILIALLLIAVTQRPRRKRQVTLALGGLLVAVGLATIGAVMSETAVRVPSPAVTIANLTGGFALLALLWWLWLMTSPSPPPMRAEPRWVRVSAGLALLAVIVQIFLGALVGAKFAALACMDFPLCGADLPWGTVLDALNPFAALTVAPNGAIVRGPALAVLHWVHRMQAHVVLVLVAILVFALLRKGGGARRLGVVIAGLLVAQLALGAASVLAQLPLALVLAHDFVAALLMTAVVTANWHVQAAARRV